MASLYRKGSLSRSTRANEDYSSGIWALVDADVSELSDRTKRINITMPERVLAVVDEVAIREGESRSALLTRAALRYVERQTGDARPAL